ncbi:restriction endonuclease subunit S [Bacteroides caecigallinarum]|uniref:restriction endonuclease subunit S n=1 Tax=Bacteroides caecigallinarum TaxID=1411144 RepID=UPI00195C09C0|nr:restriction endonuclease subunit S [Bacteroides caecigallinarum]
MPSNWTWTTLGEIFTLQAGKNITAKDISAKQDTAHCYPCYGGNGLRGYVGSYNKEGHFPLIGRQGALCGNVNEANGKFYATEHAVVVDTYCKTNIPWVINTLLYLNLNQYATSTAQPGLSVSTINEVMIPVPPLKEQQRISQSIENWFALIDQIGHSKAELQITIKQAKSKILDLAIHGKLVSQDPNDEPAIELMKRINSDFTPCDNGHYPQLPKGWINVTIKDVCKNINGLWKGKKEPFVNVGVIRNANFTKDFKLDYSNIEYIDVEERAFAQRHLLNGDLIVEKSGGSDNNPVGRAVLYEGNSGVFSYSNFTMVLRIKYKELVLSKFLYYYILAKYKAGVMKSMQTQTTGLHNLILDKYLSMPLYLPPYSEQERIINKIEDMFEKLDAIMESL